MSMSKFQCQYNKSQHQYQNFKANNKWENFKKPNVKCQNRVYQGPCMISIPLYHTPFLITTVRNPYGNLERIQRHHQIVTTILYRQSSTIYRTPATRFENVAQGGGGGAVIHWHGKYLCWCPSFLTFSYSSGSIYFMFQLDLICPLFLQNDRFVSITFRSGDNWI